MNTKPRCGKCVNCVRFNQVHKVHGEAAAKQLSDKFHCVGRAIKASTIKHQE